MNKLIIFSASWCGPCKAMAPAVEELKSQYPDNVTKYDIDAEQELRDTFEIRAVPTIILLDSNDKEIGRKTGSMSAKALEDFLLGL